MMLMMTKALNLVKMLMMMTTNIQIEIGNPDGGGLELTFDDFVLELSDGCNLDYVQVKGA